MLRTITFSKEYSCIFLNNMNCNFRFTVLNYTKYTVTLWQKARLYD